MRSFSFNFVAACCIWFGPSLLVAESPDWNQWRGPQRDSQLTEQTWPASLKPGLSLLWEKAHSPSYSGPIVSGASVFTTETIDQTTERVTAYNLDDGEVTWTVDWPGSMSVPFFAATNGDWIRSTPACVEGRLLVLGMRDLLVCLNPDTGAEFWRIDFPATLGTPLPAFGAVCSPLVDNGAVYVQTGGALVKVALADGKVLWKALATDADMMSSGAFSSPTITTLHDVRQLIVQTRLELCGVDLETGSVLWKEPIEAFRGMNILTPLVIDDKIFTSAHSGKSQLFDIQRTPEGNWNVVELWHQKTQGYMSSPVLIDDSIYLHLKNQRVTSLAVSDGTIDWTSLPFGKYWSMVANGKRILALDNEGELLLIEASKESLNIIDQLKVANDAWAHLAVQGNRVIVRDLNSLKVYQWN